MAIEGSPMNNPRVVVVGGGLAGMAAAHAMASNGLRVTLLEARRKTGGRAGSFVDPRTKQEVDYCQHVAMGCCTNLLTLLRNTQLLDQWHREPTLQFVAADGKPIRFAADRWLPAPLHLARSLLRMHYLPWGTRRAIQRGLMAMARGGIGDPQQTMAQWLQAQRQPADAIEQFWNVVLTSALGEDVSRVAYMPSRKVFVDGFMRHRDAYEVWIPKRSLHEIFGVQLPERLTNEGVNLRTASDVRGLRWDDQGKATAVMLADGQTIEADQFVIAVPWHQLGRTLGPDADRLSLPIETIQAWPTAPISGVHLYFDRPITDQPHAVLVGRLSQWMFQPSRLIDAARDSERDNERCIERGSERCDAGSEEGHYYQVVISASHGLRGASKEAIVGQVRDDLASVWPAAREARLLRSTLVTDPQAVFSVTTDTQSQRPTTATAIANLWLAGDWTATGWPATMEGAVISGFRAAQEVLDRAGRAVRVQAGPLEGSWLSRRIIRD
jgi:squalene-associated FAD-dependent desaturase